jgi:hypothetical protein
MSVYNRHLMYVLIHESEPDFLLKQEVLAEPTFAGMVKESEVLYPQDAPKPSDMISDPPRTY